MSLRNVSYLRSGLLMANIFCHKFKKQLNRAYTQLHNCATKTLQHLTLYFHIKRKKKNSGRRNAHYLRESLFNTVAKRVLAKQITGLSRLTQRQWIARGRDDLSQSDSYSSAARQLGLRNISYISHVTQRQPVC